MLQKKVKDLMISISDYGKVSHNATFFDAVKALQESQSNVPSNLQPFRAVLVVDENNNIIGKLGHLLLLKAIEPRYSNEGDTGELAKTSVRKDIIDSMMENLRILGDSVLDLCEKVKIKKVKDIMQPVSEFIDEEAPIEEAIHKITQYQSLSLLVKRKEDVVGIIRLSDLYNEIESYVLERC